MDPDEDLLATVAASEKLTAWEKEFVDSLAQQDHWTEKQQAKLEEIAEEIDDRPDRRS